MNFNQMKSPYSKLKTLGLLQNLDLKTFGASHKEESQNVSISEFIIKLTLF